VTADRDLEAVAAVLGPALLELSDAAGWLNAYHEHARDHLAAALLPLIREREAAAWERALREAADDIGEGDGISRFIGMDDLAAAVRAEKRAQQWLRDRAAANPYIGSEGE
jgi:hypothetical protein